MAAPIFVPALGPVFVPMPAPVPPPQPTFCAIPQSTDFSSHEGWIFSNQSASTDNDSEVLEMWYLAHTTQRNLQLAERHIHHNQHNFQLFYQEFQALIQNLELRLGAMESNNIARLTNIGVTDRDAPLTPLHGIATNTTIAGFPRTKAALNELDEVTLDLILKELGHLVEGGVQAKKDRLVLLTGATNIR
ncbi:hypothetical protein F4679DRAFT_548725 [Xylaria curta]|nr:hypothetical protein F4679DRAFT_548725 [Xylaria curta]